VWMWRIKEEGNKREKEEVKQAYAGDDAAFVWLPMMIVIEYRAKPNPYFSFLLDNHLFTKWNSLTNKG